MVLLNWRIGSYKYCVLLNWWTLLPGGPRVEDPLYDPELVAMS